MVKSRKDVKDFIKAPKKRISRRKINGLSGVSDELDRVYNEYRAGAITEVQARVLNLILRTKALTERDRYLDEIDKRILEIESKLNEKRRN